MSYTPQPGTIPHRVIEFLKQQPPGMEFSTYALADAIGHAGASLSMYLSTALEHGALKSEKRVPPLGGQKTSFWSLGDGTPLPKPVDYEPDEPLPQRNPSKPAAAALAPAAQPSAADTVVKRKEPAKPSKVQAVATLNRAVFGWFSDGCLVIRQQGAADLQLSQEETDDLVKFIRQVRG